MEGGKSHRFFFNHAFAEVVKFEKFIGRRFSDLFDNSRGGKKETFGHHFYHLIQQSDEARFNTFLTIGGLVSQYKPVERLTIFEYYLALEELDRRNRKNGT